ncbi:MAG: RNA polymerase sigma factor [Saprospiraceae bacterium]|nr:RNA polymerase sigma factor [Saprospiraceae bacterium]
MKKVSKYLSKASLLKEWENIQAAQKNPKHFRKIYEKHYESIFRFVYSKVHDDFLAADLVAQIFLQAMQNLHKYQFRGVPLSAWLFRLAHNQIAYYFRQQKKQQFLALEKANVQELTEENYFGEDQGIFSEKNKALLKRILNNLSISEIQLIEWRIFENRQFKEIATLLNLSANTVKMRFYRLLDKMRKRINAQVQAA